jgi:hypothetical protein
MRISPEAPQRERGEEGGRGEDMYSTVVVGRPPRPLEAALHAWFSVCGGGLYVFLASVHMECACKRFSQVLLLYILQNPNEWHSVTHS